MLWWIVLGVAVFLLFLWGSTQASLAKCMADAANPNSPTHHLASECGWQKDSLFKLYLARRSMRNGNTLLGTRELRAALNMAVKDILAHGFVLPSTRSSELHAMAETQSMLATAYVFDKWDEARGIGKVQAPTESRAPDLARSEPAPVNTSPQDDTEESGPTRDEATAGESETVRERLERQSKEQERYNEQIKDLVDSARALLRNSFDAAKASGEQHSDGLAHFIAYAVSLVALKRHYPQLLPENPDLRPKYWTFHKLKLGCVGQEQLQLMDNLARALDEGGMEALLRNLLRILGDNDGRHAQLMSDYLQRSADQAAITYMPRVVGACR